MNIILQHQIGKKTAKQGTKTKTAKTNESRGLFYSTQTRDITWNLYTIQEVPALTA